MKRLKRLCFFLAFAFMLLACEPATSENESDKKINHLTEIYADSHFRILKDSTCYLLEVFSAFRGFDGKERYVFYSKDKPALEFSNIKHYFKTPVEGLTISSTTHLGFLKEIGQTAAIVGAKGLQYAYDQNFLKRLENGEVQNLGSQSYNVEKLLHLNETVNLAYAIDGASYQEIQQLRSKGERFIMIAEFMEQDPMSKAAWLLPFALLFGEEELQAAKNYLEKLNEKYEHLKSKVAAVDSRPSVMIGLPWRGTWFVSGGDTFQAQFISDAGAKYIWQDIETKASVPISIEKVFKDAIDADFWINPGAAKSRRELLKRDQRFKQLKPMETNQIYNQNKRLSNNEGNDYWESAVVHPDLVLADLIAIFHPEKLPEHQFVYYQKLSE